MKNKTKLAIFLMILSALSFSLMQMSVKISGKSIPVMQQVFSRNLIIMIISIIVLLKNKESFLPNKESIIPLILRSLFGFFGVVASFYAFNNMILADASILQNTSPFWEKSQHHPVLTLPPTQYFNGCLYLSNLDPSSAWLKPFTLLCKLTANQH